MTWTICANPHRSRSLKCCGKRALRSAITIRSFLRWAEGENTISTWTRSRSRTLARYDCVLIVTDHTSYDYAWIVDQAQLVVDSRNATRGLQSENIVRC